MDETSLLVLWLNILVHASEPGHVTVGYSMMVAYLLKLRMHSECSPYLMLRRLRDA